MPGLRGFPSGIELSHDPAVLDGLATDREVGGGVRPLAVVRPSGTEQVERLLQWANQTRAALIPVSSPVGPRRRGDTAVMGEAVIVDLSPQRQVIHVDGDNRIAVIEPGVTFGDFDVALKPHGLRAFKPLLPRRGKSVLASYLEREPITSPYDHWDTADPLSAVELVFGNGERYRTGGAASPGTLEDNLRRGLRQMVSPGPIATDFTRVMQGAQGSLGIVCWGSVYCERLPARECAYFVPADEPAPLLDLAARFCWRRMPGQLFIVDRMQLAAMACAGRTDFAGLVAQLPAWALFASITAWDPFAEEQLAYLHGDLHQDARQLGLTPVTVFGAVSATDLQAQLQSPVNGDYKTRALGSYADFFFLSQLDRAPRFVGAVTTLARREGKGVAPAVYIQPTVHGVACHIEVTFFHAEGEERSAAALRTAAVEACAREGAFFSRPYAPWGDVAFRADPAAGKMVGTIKRLLDPNNVMNPDRFR